MKKEQWINWLRAYYVKSPTIPGFCMIEPYIALPIGPKGIQKIRNKQNENH